MYALIADGLVAALLIVTIGYCFMLNTKLQALRSGQDGLRDVITALNQATENAQNSILQLKAAGEATGADLRQAISEARNLADELSVMVEAGDNIADRLDGAVSSAERARPAPAADQTDERSGENLHDVRAAVRRIAEAAEEMDTETAPLKESLSKALGGVR